MLESPRFIQGVFAFEGRGLERPEPLQPLARHTVARDRRAQLIYFRGGNSSPELIYLVLRQNERPIRYFPLGAKAGAHIPLAIVEAPLCRPELLCETEAVAVLPSKA